MKSKLLALTLAFALFASLGLVGGATTPVDNSEPELVAVGTDVESAHRTGSNVNCKLGHTFGYLWDVIYVKNWKASNGWWKVKHKHRPVWSVWGDAHTVTSTCSWRQMNDAS